ncbi:MAG: MFS transporter [Thaumarchaeota archaeon]|nr:MFS transporter [Nitrososphaerota archaeon]
MRAETRSVVFLGLVYLLLFAGRTVIIPIIPPYARGLGATEAQIGAIVGAFGLARVIFDLPIGAVIQGYGPRRVMVLSVMVVMLASLLGATAPSLIILFAARLIEGAGMSLFFIGGLTLVASLTKTERRGRLMSIPSSMVELGTLLGPALGGIAAEYYDLTAPFYLYIFLAVVSLPFILILLRQDVAKQKPEARSSLGLFKKLLLNRDLVTVNLATFAVFVARFGVLYTGVPLLAYDNLGVSKAALGGMLAIASVASFSLLFPVGYLSDRLGRKPFMMMALGLTALSTVLVARATDATMLFFVLILYGITIGLTGPTPAWFIDVAPPELRGGAMGMYRFFNDLGQTVGPFLVGGLIELTRGAVVVPLPFDAAAIILLFMAILVSRARDPVAELRRQRKKQP